MGNRLWIEIIAIGALGTTLSGCITNSSVAGKSAAAAASKSSVSSTSTIGTSGSGSSEASDGAKDQCLAFDSSSSARPLCISCYDELVSDHCAGGSDIDACPDTAYKSIFPSELNSCINVSIIAGFTCGLTCATGFVLDASACQCITDPYATGGGSGVGGTDVGATDTGPPIVTVNADFTGFTATTGAASISDIGNCQVGNTTLAFSVRNRGDTIATQNVASPPAFDTGRPENAISAGAQADYFFESATTPAYNATTGKFTSTLSLFTGGMLETAEGGSLGSTSLVAGTVRKLSGSPQTSVQTASHVSTTVESDDVSADSIAWQRPNRVARDRYGNIYVANSRSTTVNGGISVICMDSQAIGANHWCSGITPGNVIRVAGKDLVDVVAPIDGNDDDSTVDDWLTTDAGTARANAQIRGIGGVAVDGYGNVLFSSSSSGGNVIGVVCAQSSGICNLIDTQNGGDPVVDQVLVVAGNGLNPYGGGYPSNWFALALNPLEGLDVISSATNASIVFVDFFSGKLHILCNLADGILCAVANSVTSPAIPSPTDVKINRFRNLVISSSSTSAAGLYRYCNDTGQADFCNGVGLGMTALSDPPSNAGTTTPSADGTTITSAVLAPISAIALDLDYAGAYEGLNSIDSGIHPALTDDNILIIEQGDSTATQTIGNKLKIVCGPSATPSGYCADKTASAVYTLAGARPTSYTITDQGSVGSETTFLSLYGVTYDIFKNIIVTSTSREISTGVFVVDQSLYQIAARTESASSGVRYSISDSAGLSSHYCFRLKVLNECGFYNAGSGSPSFACTCSAIPASEDFFIPATSSADTCL